MKYFILLGDGMADLPIQELLGYTPLQQAYKPNINSLAPQSECGLVRTIPDNMEPGSGPANMSVMGYPPEKYYTGRSPLEALSLGIQMAPDDMVFRCNLVSLSGNPDELGGYEKLTMKDYSAGEISTLEASKLIDALATELTDSDLHFYPGRSYRHCTVWEKGPGDTLLTPPHDITGKEIMSYLPSGNGASRLLGLMKKSYEILKNHPINVARRNSGKNTADSIWLWGQGTRPAIDDFTTLYGKTGAVISAVDLIFGLGRGAGLEVIEVDGATGTLDTNFAGKGQAAIRAFSTGIDYVYLHVEAPDECGHHGDIFGKVQAIEWIDEAIAGPVLRYLEDNRKIRGEDYHFMVLPDHPTPTSIKTHTSDPVPFLLYRSEDKNHIGIANYCECEATQTKIFYESGPALFAEFIK